MNPEHLGFNFAPFERKTQAEMLYEWPHFHKALARLAYACEKRSLAVITGVVDSGKSTLLRMLGHRFDANAYPCLYLDIILNLIVPLLMKSKCTGKMIQPVFTVVKIGYFLFFRFSFFGCEKRPTKKPNASIAILR